MKNDINYSKLCDGYKLTSFPELKDLDEKSKEAVLSNDWDEWRKIQNKIDYLFEKILGF